MTAACPVSTEFDPFDDVFQSDPAGWLHDARRETPVFFSTQLGYYVVTRYEDIRRVLKDTDTFSTELTAGSIVPLCAAAQETLRRQNVMRVKTLGADDTPLHMRRRRALMELFTPAGLERWAPRIREVVDASIDRFVTRGSADLVSELFWEAPAVVALEFMGVPDDEVQLAKRFAAGIMKFKFGRPSEGEQVATCELMGESQAYGRDLLERIKLDPAGDGFLPVLIRAWMAEPELFDDAFLLGLATTTVAAAHETTSHAEANSMLLLLSRRARWDALCRDPALIPGAVEESLRVGPSLISLRRLCLADSVIGGVPIPAGAKLMLSIASGNVDDETFERAAEFELDRRNARRHLTFGSGPHVCLGAGLARVQMRVALEQLTRRLPHVRLTAGAPITYVPMAAPHGPQALWVDWDPEQNPVPADRPHRGAGNRSW